MRSQVVSALSEYLGGYSTNFGFYSKCEGKSFEIEGRIVT